MRRAGLFNRTSALALHRVLRSSVRAGLAALMLLTTTPSLVLAQMTTLKRAAAAPPDDGLGPRDIMLQADLMSDDRDANIVTAEGHVEARMQGRTLRSDKLIYNRRTGETHAIGHAVVVNADGTSEYGDDMLLDDQFRAGLAYGFSARDQDNITLTAGVAVRRNETIDQLNDAVYTACTICAKDGTPKNPTWAIQASRITQDREHHVIYYRNAVVKILGVPVFYAPVFWHPDPTSPRRSGLLTPKLQYGARRGFSYEQPYLFVLSPSSDFTLSPQINTRVNPLMNTEFVERFYSGMLDVRAGYTWERDFDNHKFYGKETSRSFILAQGLFNIDRYWTWGFGAERVTDPTFFQRYSTPEVYTDRGPFPTSTNHLITQLFTRRQDDDTFVSVAAMDFQDLTVFGRNTDGSLIAESDKSFPIVGPLIEARYDPNEPVLGGQLSIQTSAVALSRNQPVVSINDPSSIQAPGAQQLILASSSNAGTLASIAATAAATKNSAVTALTYTDQRRASLEAKWDRTFTFDNGIQVQPFLQAHGDVYSVSNSTLYTFNNGVAVAHPGEDSVARGLATVGANVSWPFIRNFGTTSVVLEPLAQIAIAPSVGLNPYIPNEDSVSFEYDDTNLFSLNRFSGDDLLESGQRLNLGGRATVDWGGGREASFLIGRTFRAERDPVFDVASGLSGTESDWVTSLTANPIDGVSVFTRERLASGDFTLRHSETGVNFSVGRNNLSLRYDYNVSGYQIGAVTLNGVTNYVSQIGQTQDATISGQVFLTQRWGVGANVTRDLQENIFPLAQLDLIYLDDCLRIDLLYTHDQTYGNVIGTSDAVTFRITLATLGGTPANPNRAGAR